MHVGYWLNAEKVRGFVVRWLWFAVAASRARVVHRYSTPDLWIQRGTRRGLTMRLGRCVLGLYIERSEPAVRVSSQLLGETATEQAGTAIVELALAVGEA